MIASLVGSFVIGIILLGLFELLGVPAATDRRDINRFAVIMAIVCGVMWLIGGLGFDRLLAEIGTWIGYMAAVMTVIWVHQQRHISSR